MPGTDVLWSPPLVRQSPWYPSQFGVPGAGGLDGERLHCTGKVLYVDPNFPGASDQRDGTEPSAPLATIQAAVDMTTDYAGDVIVVMQNGAWQYAGGTVYRTGIVESVVLDRAGVRILGVSPGGVGVPWTAGAAGEFALTITGIDCLVEGFAYSAPAGGGNGIYAEWDGVTAFADNVVIQHCLFDDSIDIAVQLEYAWYCYVRHCFFEECDTCAVYVDPAGSGIAYVEISDNWFQDCALALSLDDADNCKITRNHIFNAAAQGGGAATDEGIDTSAGSDNIVSDNFFSCILPAASPGDYDDLNTASATDAWINNHCMNGDAITNPT